MNTGTPEINSPRLLYARTSCLQARLEWGYILYISLIIMTCAHI